MTSLLGGMPPPIVLTDIARLRLEAISFFIATILVSAVVVRWLWNSLRDSFPKLPRLTYGKALTLVLIWGLMFVIVLTMISGARELMTPGAWEKQGPVYRLKGEAK